MNTIRRCQLCVKNLHLPQPNVLKKVLLEPKWTKEQMSTLKPANTEYSDRLDIVKKYLNNLDPSSLWKTVRRWNNLFSSTHLYYSQKNEHAFFVSKSDLKLFVEILLLRRYHNEECISHNQFQEIKKYLHLPENNLDMNHKMTKIYAMKHFWRKSTDKRSHMKFFVRHSNKLDINGNPVRFGYKNWILFLVLLYI